MNKEVKENVRMVCFCGYQSQGLERDVFKGKRKLGFWVSHDNYEIEHRI